MKKQNLVSVTKSLVVPSALALSLLMTGCGGTFGDDTTDEAKKYEVATAIDGGNYDKAISMLEKDCAGYNYEDCQLQLGTAYLAKAGYDITTIGTEMFEIDANDDPSLTQADKDKQLTTVLLSKMLDDNMELGVNVLKSGLLDNNTSQCTPARYGSMTSIQKQACLAVNPMMLKDLMGDVDLNTTDDNVVSLELIIAFADVAESIMPGMEVDEFVAIINGGSDLDPIYDVNGNGEVDSVEITECAIKAYNSSDLTVCAAGVDDDKNISLTPTIPFPNLKSLGSYGDYNVTIAEVDGTASGLTNKIQVRLLTMLAGTHTTVSTTDKFIDGSGAYVATCVVPDLGTTCFPEPVLNNGVPATAADAIVEILNDDNLLNTIASTTGSESGTTSTDLREEICYADYPTNTINNCDVVGGELVIKQDAFLAYSSRDK